MLNNRTPRIWAADTNHAWKDNGENELVMQREAAFELGANGKGSANYVLFTSNTDLINEDKVMLFGPDLNEIKGDSDFARVVLLRIGLIDGDDEVVYKTLKDIEFTKYHVYPDGYMIRMSPESCREQIRVSKKSLKNRISFEAIGNLYINAYKKNYNVLNAVVIFITDPGIDYTSLQNLAKKTNKVTGTLTHILEGLPTDCSVCSLKEICDEVEGMKELHFGVCTQND